MKRYASVTFIQSTSYLLIKEVCIIISLLEIFTGSLYLTMNLSKACCNLSTDFFLHILLKSVKKILDLD